MKRKEKYKVVGNKTPDWLREARNNRRLKKFDILLLLAIRDEFAREKSSVAGVSVEFMCDSIDDALNRGWVRIISNGDGFGIVPTEEGFTAVNEELARVLPKIMN